MSFDSHFEHFLCKQADVACDPVLIHDQNYQVLKNEFEKQLEREGLALNSELENCLSLIEASVKETAYRQGIKDGFALKNILTNTNI